MSGCIEINDSSLEFVLEIHIGFDHKIDCVEMLWFPFDVALIESAYNIFGGIVIEDGCNVEIVGRGGEVSGHEP